jgi:uncharacterized protein YbaR (Trm112 family)
MTAMAEEEDKEEEGLYCEGCGRLFKYEELNEEMLCDECRQKGE